MKIKRTVTLKPWWCDGMSVGSVLDGNLGQVTVRSGILRQGLQGKAIVCPLWWTDHCVEIGRLSPDKC